MTLYTVFPWKEDEGCNGLPSDFLTYREAQEWGKEYCPSGYDIESCDCDSDYEI